MPRLIRDIRIIEDAIDVESQNERLDSRVMNDAIGFTRYAEEEPPVEPPTAGGVTYLRECADCARPFRTEDIHAVLCWQCDADDDVLFQHAWKHNYNYGRRKFRRGGGWE